MENLLSATTEIYLIPSRMRSSLSVVLPLRMSDILGIGLAAAALFGGSYDMVHASAAFSFDSGEFFRGGAIASLGLGHGLAVIELGRVPQP